jgi:hypothetical protein
LRKSEIMPARNHILLSNPTPPTPWSQHNHAALTRDPKCILIPSMKQPSARPPIFRNHPKPNLSESHTPHSPDALIFYSGARERDKETHIVASRIEPLEQVRIAGKLCRFAAGPSGRTGRDSTVDDYCSPLRIADFSELIKTI